MNADDYQKAAARTLIERPGFDISDNHMMLVWNVIGLCGEAGELAEIIKKGIFHRHNIDPIAARKELGDVLWYVAALCTKFGFSMSDVMDENIAKLKKRYPNGYASEDSVKRVDVEAEAQA